MANEQPRDLKADRPDGQPEQPDDKPDAQPHELRVVELGEDGQGVVDEEELGGLDE